MATDVQPRDEVLQLFERWWGADKNCAQVRSLKAQCCDAFRNGYETAMARTKAANQQQSES
jgi:hypothetical protein